MNITIRTATAVDAHDFAYILCESWKAAYKDIIPPDVMEQNTNIEKRESMFSTIMKSDTAKYYIAYDGEKPCGICSTGSARDDDMPECGEIVAIYTLPEYWGKGVGKSLMEAALDGLRKQGFTHFLLWVLEKNLRARRFYEKCGFSPDGTKKTGHGEAMEIRYLAEGKL